MSLQFNFNDTFIMYENKFSFRKLNIKNIYYTSDFIEAIKIIMVSE